MGKTLALGSDVPLVLAEPMPAAGTQEVIIETPAHDRDLPDLSAAELAAVVETYYERFVALAHHLGDLLRRYRDLADDPAYNLILHSAPRVRTGSRAHHWFVQLRPRIHRIAGFELASGVHINPSLPEHDAGTLKGER